jgi:serine carboxypeptidase-like clade 1
MRSLLLLSILLACTLVYAAIPAHQVTYLPGYGTPKVPTYSGLIALDKAVTTYMHYWLQTSTASNPSTAPLVLWLNGGPGCSSLEGAMFENGAYAFTGEFDANGLPTLKDNPTAWTTIANMVYLEAPAGVGFSFYTNGSTTTNDEITSQNNYQFLLNFFESYPEYVSNDFYIFGESYAGIYVPTLVDRIRLGNAAGNPKINLIGFGVGNGCWGNDVGACAMYDGFDDGTGDFLQFLYGHSMFSQQTNIALLEACGGNYSNPNPSQQCQDLQNQAQNEGGDYNIYDIYDECPNPVSTSNNVHLRAPSRHIQKAMNSGRKLTAVPNCIQPDNFANPWFDNSTVQDALHVSQANVNDWSVCADVDYEKTVGSLLPLYPTLIKNYKVLIYSGDVDACVPHTGSERWTRNLGIEVKAPWRPWTIDEQVYGYVVEYDADAFYYLTIKDAGHMVPQYQPEAALAFFTRFLQNQPF